jgi:hypothetical protein
VKRSRRAIPRLRTAFGRRAKSIGLDNLAHLARALRVPMTELLE